MKKTDRLHFIIELSQRQEQNALQLLGQNQQKLLEKQAQLDQLRQYKIEKQNSFHTMQSAGLSIMQFREMRAFADKLDQAIEAQQLMVSNQEQDLLRVQKQWEEHHQRTLNLQKISDIAKHEALKAEFKREQQELDTRAARSQRKDGT